MAFPSFSSFIFYLKLFCHAHTELCFPCSAHNCALLWDFRKSHETAGTLSSETVGTLLHALGKRLAQAFMTALSRNFTFIVLFNELHLFWDAIFNHVYLVCSISAARSLELKDRSFVPSPVKTLHITKAVSNILNFIWLPETCCTTANKQNGQSTVSIVCKHYAASWNKKKWSQKQEVC